MVCCRFENHPLTIRSRFVSAKSWVKSHDHGIMGFDPSHTCWKRFIAKSCPNQNWLSSTRAIKDGTRTNHNPTITSTSSNKVLFEGKPAVNRYILGQKKVFSWKQNTRINPLIRTLAIDMTSVTWESSEWWFAHEQRCQAPTDGVSGSYGSFSIEHKPSAGHWLKEKHEKIINNHTCTIRSFRPVLQKYRKKWDRWTLNDDQRLLLSWSRKFGPYPLRNIAT